MKPIRTISGSLCWVRASVIFVIVASSASAAIIGVDARHGDASSRPDANLATGADFDEFRSILAGGNTLVNLNSFTASELAGLDALIVRQSPTTTGVFTSGEISDIHAFVDGGHGLLIMGEGGFSTSNTVGNLNSLAAPFGVNFDVAPIHGEGFTVNGFVAHPVTLGITSIGMDFYRRMTAVAAPALDLTVLSGEDDVLAAVNGINGGGNVVLLSDTSLWADVTSASDRNIAFGDNRLLLQNTIAFVAVPEPTTFLIALIGGLIVPVFWRRRRHNTA